VRTYVKSLTHTRFGASAWKHRLRRSPARTPSLAGIVVRVPLSRRTPARPSALIARSTAPAEASGTVVRRSSAVIFRRPYSPSGVILRTPSGPVVHTAARTASRTTASETVRAATRGRHKER